MARTRILHLIPALGAGGAERQLVDLVERIDHAEFEPIVLMFGGSEHFRPRLAKAGIRVESLGITRTGIGALPSLIGPIRKFIQSVGPDVVHTWLFEANVAARFAMRGMRVPLVTSAVAPEYDRTAAKAAGWPATSVEARRQIELLSLRMSSPLFVADSAYVASCFRRDLQISGERMRLIHHSVSPSITQSSETRQQLRKRIGVPSDAKMILHVGRLVGAKRQDFLIEILHGLGDSFLVLVGEGETEKSLQALARSLGIAERVCFPGVQQNIGGFLAAADLFAFPSTVEGFPLAVLEAMMAGLPIVVSDAPPLDEMIDHGVTGWRVASHDRDAWIQTLRGALDDPAKSLAVGAAARTMALERFSTDVVVPRWETLYRQSCNEAKISYR